MLTSTPSRLKPLTPGDSRHGKRSSFTNHGCRCDRCKAAEATYRRQLKARKSGQPVFVSPPVRLVADEQPSKIIRPTSATVRAVWDLILTDHELPGSLADETLRTVLAHPVYESGEWPAWDMVTKGWYFRHQMDASAMTKLALEAIDIVAAQR